jgi:two-component sensor histidine kinase
VQKLLPYFFFFIAYCNIAQVPIHYTTSDGLPSNLVYDIVQDSNGFMWFATNMGVAKFDGAEFVKFTSKDGLPNNDTWRLEADTLGHVYFASKSKYQGYIKNDSINTFTTTGDKVISPSLFKTDNGMIWIANGIEKLQGQQLVKASGSSEVIKRIEKIFYKENLGALRVILPLQTDLNLLLTNNQIRKLNGDLQDIEAPISLNILDNFSANIRYCTYSIGYNATVLVVLENGLLFYNHNKHKTFYYPFEELYTSTPNKGENSRILFLKDEIQAKVGGLLYRFNYQYELKEVVEIPVKRTIAAYIDTSNNLWMSNGKGILMYAAPKRISATHLSNQVVNKLGSINDNLYAGAFKEGFFRYVDDSFEQLPKLVGTESIYDIEDLAPGSNSFLIGGLGLYVIDKKNNQLFSRLIVGDQNKSAPVSFKDIIPTDQETYYGITSGTVESIDKNLQTARSLIFKTGLLQIERQGDTFFTGGSDGLHKIMGNTLVKIAPESFLTSTSILKLKTYNDTLYVGTNGSGLYRYYNDNIWHLSSTDGLSIQEIIKERDTLWLATNEGVKKLVLPKLATQDAQLIDQFYDADGLLENNTNDIYKTGDTLFVATDSGVSELNIKSSLYQAPIKLYFKTKFDTLRKSYSKTDDLTIGFGAIDFNNMKHLQFQYRLAPSQNEWTPTKATSVNFSNLSPGTYTLWVKAVNQHFIEGKKSLKILIAPLWWQTTIAKIAFISLALLIFILFALIIRYIIRKSEQKKNNRDKRMAALELQALRSQMNPHFVHNSLNAIQYYIQRNEVELSENYLSKFSKLIRLFFEYSRKETLSLKEEIDLLTHYLEIEKLRFEDKLNYTIETDPKLDIEEQVIPSMILQPIVENAVNHGIFHKTESGTIKIKFTAIQNGYRILIEDDGIGIKKAKELYTSSTKNYRSKSSAVLEERLALLDQSDRWSIQYDTVDISEVSENTGTRVTLTFNAIT